MNKNEIAEHFVLYYFGDTRMGLEVKIKECMINKVNYLILNESKLE